VYYVLSIEYNSASSFRC